MKFRSVSSWRNRSVEEVCLRGRQRLRPHCHLFYVFLERLVFLERALDGFIVYCFGFLNTLTFLFVYSLCFRLLITRLGGSHHDLIGGIAVRL